MDKQSFITSLKEKAGVDNISERSYEEVANLFATQFEDDEKVTDETWNVPVQIVKTMSGQNRHDVSAAIKEFKTQSEADQKAAIEKAVAEAKAEWEKAQKGAETTDTDKADVDKKVSDAVEAAIAKITGEDGAFGKLSKQFSDYLASQAAKEKAATEADIRNQVREYLIMRGVDEEDFALEYTLEKLVIGDNPDVNALKTKAEKDYEAYYKKIHKGDSAKPFNGGGGEGGGVSGAEAWLKEREGLTDAETKAAEARKKLLK